MFCQLVNGLRLEGIQSCIVIKAKIYQFDGMLTQTISVCEVEKRNIEEKLISRASISKKLANPFAIEDTKIPDEDNHIEIGNSNQEFRI